MLSPSQHIRLILFSGLAEARVFGELRSFAALGLPNRGNFRWKLVVSMASITDS